MTFGGKIACFDMQQEAHIQSDFGNETYLGRKETIMKAKKATKTAQKGKKLSGSKLPKATLQRASSAQMHEKGMH